jgi:prevent-host-death family protein
MRTVNVAELKNKLSAYLGYAKAGETVVVRDRNRPIAKLVPFVAEGATEEELELVARGILKWREKEMNWEEFDKLPLARLNGDAAGTDSVTRALLEEREEGW